MSVPNLAVFKAAFDKVKDDIMALQRHQIMISSDLVIEESKHKAPLFDITIKLVNKGIEKGNKKNKGK